MKYVYIIERLHKDVVKDRLSKTIMSTFSSKAKAFNHIVELMNDLNQSGWRLVFDKFPNEPDYLRSTQMRRDDDIINYRVYKFEME